DRPNAALAVANVSPAFAYGVTDGRDQPESCDYDSSLRHALGPLFRGEMRSTYQAGFGFVLLGQDVVDGLLNSRDLFSVLVRNFGFELLLQSHHELHRIQGIGAQVVDERRIVSDLVGLDSQLLGNDSPNLVFDAAHVSETPH